MKTLEKCENRNIIESKQSSEEKLNLEEERCYNCDGYNIKCLGYYSLLKEDCMGL